MRDKLPILLVTALISLSISACAQQPKTSVQIVGEMRNVMWKGQLSGNIDLDTISNKKNLYGLGPVEYLAGEIMVIDGKSYKSTVVSESEMKVEETFDLKAPFFGSSNISAWKSKKLPDSIINMKDLEAFIDSQTKASKKPFMFKIDAEVDEAIIHIVNLPKGSKVSSPDEAHKGQINYPLKNVAAEIVGFFSTEHKAILTHHDTYLHMHLITKDRKQMGHLDSVKFKPGTVTLHIPAQ